MFWGRLRRGSLLVSAGVGVATRKPCTVSWTLTPDGNKSRVGTGHPPALPWTKHLPGPHGVPGMSPKPHGPSRAMGTVHPGPWGRWG